MGSLTNEEIEIGECFPSGRKYQLPWSLRFPNFSPPQISNSCYWRDILFLEDQTLHQKKWWTVGVTNQPLHFAPSIKHLSCLTSISFRGSSASLLIFICCVQCTLSIDHFCSEHQTPHSFIHILRPFCSEHRAPRATLLRHPCFESSLLQASSLSFSYSFLSFFSLIEDDWRWHWSGCL